MQDRDGYMRSPRVHAHSWSSASCVSFSRYMEFNGTILYTCPDCEGVTSRTRGVVGPIGGGRDAVSRRVVCGVPGSGETPGGGPGGVECIAGAVVRWAAMTILTEPLPAPKKYEG